MEIAERESVLSWVMGRLRQLAPGTLLARSGMSVLDQAVVSGTSFATSVLLGRCASREELGVYYLALSIVYFARGVQEQLVSAPYMIYCGRKTDAELPVYAGSTLIHQLVFLVVTAAAIGAWLLTGLAPQGAEQAFWLMVLAAPLMLVREFARQLSFAHLELTRATLLDMSAAVLQFALLFGLAVFGKLTAPATLAAIAIPSGLATIGWLAFSQRPVVVQLSRAVGDWWHNWLFARWALASQLLASTTPYVMPWAVALTHGEAQTGMLGACTTLVGLSNTFLNGLCNFLSPQAAQAFSRGGLPELKSVLLKTAALFLTTLGGLCVVAFLFGERFALLVYGQDFAGAGTVIAVLSLSVLANSVGITAGNGLWAMERPSANFVADLVSLIVVIGTSLVLVPQWGPLGAAVATLSGTSTDAAVRLAILIVSMREFEGSPA